MPARSLLLAAAGLVASAGLAPAQFFPRFGPQMPSGVYVNSPLGGYYFNTQQSYQFTFSGTVSGRPFTISQEYYWSGFPRPTNYYVLPSYYPTPYDSTAGGSGSYGSDVNNPLVARQRAAIARAQRANEWDNPVAGRKDDIDNWVAAHNRGGNNPVAVPPIDPVLLDPPDEAILSAKALNELLALCLKQEKDGRRADSGLCPPELLEKVAFEGGVAAAGINLFRKPKLTYPTVVEVPETAKLRAAIDTEFAAIGTSLRAGKKPNLNAVDRLDAALAAARKALNLRMKESPFAEEKAVNDFLTQVEQAAKFARNADAPAALSATWYTTGATVAELIRLMDKFKIRFGQAPTGGEPAYLSLHRGLLGYYVRLAPAPAAK